MLLFAICGQHLSTLIGQHGVYGRYNCYVWSEITVIPDSDLCIILDRQIKISEKLLSYFSVYSVMKEDRSLYNAPLT